VLFVFGVGFISSVNPAPAIAKSVIWKNLETWFDVAFSQLILFVVFVFILLFEFVEPVVFVFVPILVKGLPVFGSMFLSVGDFLKNTKNISISNTSINVAMKIIFVFLGHYIINYLFLLYILFYLCIFL